MSESAPARSSAAWLVAGEAAGDFELWGITSAERLRRTLAAAGCTDVRVLAGGDAAPESPADVVVILRADWIFDERLITALLTADAATCLVADDGTAVATRSSVTDCGRALAALRNDETPRAGAVRTASQLAPAYSAKLRKNDPPYLLRARSDDLPAIEARTFAASYKGATDLVTKWVWPAPARWLTRRLACAHVHPNTVTLLSWVCALAATWAFWEGSYAAGLAAAWAMTFLDTVDGKLARVTLTSSRLGDVLDHSLDLVHPPFWWWAWGAGIGWELHPATWIVIGGYFLGRALEGAFLAGFGFETHSWRPIDTLFRTITARRNPNLLLLSVATAGARPDLGLVMVALWTALSLGFHAVRLGQAALVRWHGKPVEPWDLDLPRTA